MSCSFEKKSPSLYNYPVAKNFITSNEYYKSLFGKKVYKISLDAGCTCPTRDGTKGYGGCIFCSQSGSGDFATSDIDTAKEIVARKLRGRKGDVAYIAYFQNFTNTYGDLDRLKKLWLRALEDPEVVGLALGTRPDCLSKECIKVLDEIAATHFVQIELGFQTSNEKSAAYFRRGYENKVYKDAVFGLHATQNPIHVVTHLMFGLPSGEMGRGTGDGGAEGENQKVSLESACDMMESVRYAVDAGTDGIKITNLYVLKNTELGQVYEKGGVPVLSMEEYVSLLKDALEIIPENVIIHRLTGDPPKSLILAPDWCCNKKMMLDQVNKLLGKGSYSLAPGCVRDM